MPPFWGSRIDPVSHVLQPLGLPRLVPLREFIVSPGFAGAAALVAAVITLCAVLYWSRRAHKRFQLELEQRERHHQEAREDELHAAAVTRCWERLVWVVETAGIEPTASEGAALGLGPQLALELLRGLLRDSEQLADNTLVKAVTVYTSQLSLVLAQQGGPLAELAATASPLTDGKPDKQPAPSSADNTPDTPPAAAGAEKPRATGDVGNERGARRQ